MSAQHVAGFALYLVLAAGVAQAQKPTSEVHLDTLTILKGDSPSDVRVRLVGVGAHVQIVKFPNLEADTLELTTPVQVVLPAQAFSLSVSTPTDATVTIMSDAASHGGRGRFRSTIHAPFTLKRAATNGSLSVTAGGNGRSERVP